MIERRDGFTIIEVLIAIMILSVGVLALASSAGGVSRMLSSGQRKTRSYSIIASTMDSLRNKANTTTPKCTALASGSSTTTASYGSLFSRAWTVSTVGTGRRIVMQTSYRVGGRTKGDTLIAEITC